MIITIAGTGCSKCRTLEKVTRDAVNELGIVATIVKEEDIVKILNYGIIQPPGLVVNGKVVLSGQVPSVNQAKEIINRNK